MNGYIVLIEGQGREEIYAETTIEAWEKARKMYRGHKRRPEIDVFLAERHDGTQYVHTAVN